MEEQYGQLIEPSPVPFSFGAPGWYVLGLLLFLVLIAAILLLYRHYRRNLYRKKALQFLDSIEQELSSQKNYDGLLYESNMLIKRIAMSKYPRKEVASSRSKEWISYINKSCRKELFDANDERLLNNTIYQLQPAVAEEEARQFVLKTKQWIRKHRAK